MITNVTSKNNDLLTHIRKLQNDRKYRQQHRLFVGEGTKLLGEAMKYELRTVVMAGDAEFPALDDSVRRVRVTPQLMKSISLLTTPQDALFVCAMPHMGTPDSLAGSGAGRHTGPRQSGYYDTYRRRTGYRAYCPL